MRRGVGLFVTISLGMLIVLEAPRVAEAVARADVFRLIDVSVEGANFMTRDELLTTAALPMGGSIWESLDPAAARLGAHPLIREARLRRRLPGTLVVEVREREPVAFLPAPVLTPVDSDARLLPISPAERRLDLPILQPRVDGQGKGTELTPGQLRKLSKELVHLGELDPALLASVSEIALDSWGDVLLHLDQPRSALRYRAPLIPARLNDGLRVLEDALDREPGRELVSVDLRFPDQVVVRFADSRSR